MAVEKKIYIKRTVWVADCPHCDWNKVATRGGKREARCPNCRAWVPYVETSYEGPDING